MSSAWDRASQRADEVQSGVFVKLQADGDRVVGIFVGDPEIEETFFNPKTNRTETYTEQHKAQNLTAQPVFKMNFYVLAETNERGALIALAPKERGCKILSVKAPTFKEIRLVKEKYGLDRKVFEVRRHGAKGQTNTRYTIMPEEQPPLDAALLKEAYEAKRQDLKRRDESAQTDVDSYDRAKAASASDFVDPETLTTIIARLKALPHEKMVRWMTTFGLAQVKLLPRAKIDESKRLLDELEGKNAAAPPPPPPPAPATIDPFAV
jgi:hypothetical protein